MLTHLDLFSGIGGFALACQWAGIETIGFVEIDKYCQKVLRKHWPDVPIVEDIRDVERIKEIVANATAEGWMAKQLEAGISGEALCETPAGQPCRTDSVSGIRTAGDSDPIKPALLITAGFPCQPFSVAGKRGGKEDDRYLWPETLAVIKAVKPDWILLENVTGIINLALDQVLSDLEGAGYACETLIIPACAVNAWHRRDRVWIVAHYAGNGFPRTRVSISKRRPKQKDLDLGRHSQIVSDAESRRCQEQCGTIATKTAWPELECSMWWSIEPELGRVAHGIPRRVDRLKCLGNVIVPQVAYEIIKAIKEVVRLLHGEGIAQKGYIEQKGEP
jgi:DNA (cytosine-5)-methyltransferase 1